MSDIFSWYITEQLQMNIRSVFEINKSKKQCPALGNDWKSARISTFREDSQFWIHLLISLQYTRCFLFPYLFLEWTFIVIRLCRNYDLSYFVMNWIALLYVHQDLNFLQNNMFATLIHVNTCHIMTTFQYQPKM